MVSNSGFNSGVMAQTINEVHLTLDNKKRIPSILPKFIEILANQYSISPPKRRVINTQPYTIEEKIEYNKVLLFQEVIDEFYIYYPICESSFESLRHVDENSKNKILADINDIYRQIKLEYFHQSGGSITKLQELIKDHSDLIIFRVKDKINAKVQNSYDGERFTKEELTLCLNIFVCYALGECKILERPKEK